MKNNLFLLLTIIIVAGCNNDYTDLIQNGNYPKAIEILNKEIESDTINSKLYLYRAIAYSNLKEYDNAKADLDKSIKYGDNNVQAYFELGKIYYSKKNYEKAHDYFLGVNILDSNIDSEYYLALCCYNLNMYEKAVSYCETSIKKYPRSIKNYFFYHIILLKIESVPSGE
jgi:tetratricopeptide (TPR) repeat protein